MGKKHLLAAGAALASTAAVILPAGAALAAPTTATCGNGQLGSGTYGQVLVTGHCSVPAHANITVLNNVIVAPGAIFDAQSAPAKIRIGGSVIGGSGSMVGLGCTPAHGCEPGTTYGGQSSTISVAHNIALDHVYNAAFNGIEVGGNLVSSGGGAGFVGPQQFVPFSVKDDTIHGNLVVNDLTTTWFGVIRSKIGGNVVLTNIRLDDPDGNEIVADTIGKNLVCLGLNPHPHLGDAVEGAPPGYGASTVGGHRVGQCVSIH